jgi:hypothetical protein
MGGGMMEGDNKCLAEKGCNNIPCCYVADECFDMIPCCNEHAKGLKDEIGDILKKVIPKT